VSGITGIDKLRKDAEVFRRGLGEALGRELQATVDQPIRTFERNVRSAVRSDLPARYAGVYGGSFRLKVNATAGSAGIRVKLVGTAKGKAQIRDSAALNRGLLRHKRWGHLPWYSQSVTPGFWDDPAKVLAVDVRKAVEVAVDKTAAAVEAQL
jgi:hypothetical protein